MENIITFKNNSKNIVALLIEFQGGSFSESKETEGYTHIAEHFMFHGSKKYTKEFLEHNIFDKIIFNLEARTSRDRLELFCYFDIFDFDLIIDIIHHIIFNWDTKKESFYAEKNHLLSEHKEFSRSKKKLQAYSTFDILPAPKSKPLGSYNKLKKISYNDIIKIKKYWQWFITNHEHKVFILGSAIKKKHEDLLKNKITEYKKSKNTIVYDYKNITNPSFTIKNKENILILYTQQKSLPFLADFFSFLLFERSMKLLKNNFYYSFYNLDPINALSLFSENHNLKNKSLLKKLIYQNPTKKEFNNIRAEYTREFRRFDDGVDPIDTLLRLRSLYDMNFGGKKLKTLSEIKKWVEQLKFEEFKSFHKKIINP